MDLTLIINEAIKSGNGLWAILFVSLFVWNLLESKAREKTLQEIINKVNDKVLTGVCSTETRVQEIDSKLDEVDIKVDTLDRKVDGIIIKIDGMEKRI